MKKLLHIIATPRSEDSRTLNVSTAFLKSFSDTHPDWVIEDLNLSTEELPALSVKRVDGKYILLEGLELSGQFRAAWQDIISQIERFLSADAYLISTPMWNFSIPYFLKHYIDVIVQPKYLFQYTKTGVEGLAKNRKMVVITSSGGDYSSGEAKQFDHIEPYLRTVFGYAGIKDIQFIKAQPMDMDEHLKQQRLSLARTMAEEIAAHL